MKNQDVRKGQRMSEPEIKEILWVLRCLVEAVMTSRSSDRADWILKADDALKTLEESNG